MVIKLMQCKKLLQLVLQMWLEHFLGMILPSTNDLKIYPRSNFDLKRSFTWNTLMILFIMRCRPSAFLIHVRISSTKQIFTLDLIFVAHNSCGQNWVIFLIRQSFYFKKDFVPRGPNEKQDVKINLIQMVWNLGRCIWSKNYDLKIEKGEFVPLVMWFSTRDIKTGYN